MNIIQRPELTLQPNPKNKTAWVQVSCELHFSEQDVAIMRKAPQRMYFSLYCTLMGRDKGNLVGFQTDDTLYAFESQVIPGGKPKPVQHVDFKATVSEDMLNEDIVGTDEIYARLEIRGWIDFKGLHEAATTDVCQFAFA